MEVLYFYPMKKKFYILLLAIFPVFNSYANNSSKSAKDSLAAELKSANGERKVDVLNLLSEEWRKKDLHEALKYANLALKKAISIGYPAGIIKSFDNLGLFYYYQDNYDSALIFYEKSIKLKQGFDKDKDSSLAKTFNNLGMVYQAQGNFDKALIFYEKALSIDKKLGIKKGMAKCFNNIGLIYYYKGEYNEALKYYFESLKIKEKLNDIKGISVCFNNIGLIHYFTKNWEKAIEYYKKSLEIKKKIGNKKGVAICYNNIGNIHIQKKEYNQAIIYYQKSLEIKEDIRDKKGISEAYNNIGLVYNYKGDYKKSIQYLKKALEIKTAMGDMNGIAIAFENIADIYIKIASSSSNNDTINTYYKKAIDAANRGLGISNEIGALATKKVLFKKLSKAYQGIKDHLNALMYYKLYKNANDSIFSIKKMEQLQKIEVQYQVKKKQQEIEKQELLIQKKNAEVKRQNIQRNALVIGFVLVLILIVILYHNYRQKRKIAAIIQSKNESLEAANCKITEQKNKAISIHNKLAKSIDYARRIQKTMLPENSFLEKHFPEHFIFYKPHSVVSGDFYWAAKIGQKLIFTVADSTGHGVPGAFMSVLGISQLNEIVSKNSIDEADNILNELRENVIFSLKQKNTDSGQRDGIDMSLCVLDTQTLKLEFAGADNPLYIVRQNNTRDDLNHYALNALNNNRALKNKTHTLHEIKGDLMPISIYDQMDSFIKHEIQLLKGDILYISTDGYADQFDRNNHIKFKKRPFKKLLLSISDKPMKEQFAILDKTFQQWKGENEQTDDVCIWGIRI